MTYCGGGVEEEKAVSWLKVGELGGQQTLGSLRSGKRIGRGGERARAGRHIHGTACEYWKVSQPTEEEMRIAYFM